MSGIYAEPIKPLPLNPGDTIGIVAPASWVEEEKITQCVQEIQARGFRVRLASNIGKQDGRFAGTDEERAQGFMDCWLDPEVKAVWCIRGGYGTGRILPLLDFAALKEHPKIFMGMSDITALHTAFNRYLNLVTFLGPVATHVFAPPEGKDPTFSEENAWKAFHRDHHFGQEFLYTYPHIETVREGIAEGRLVGGNLALTAAHVGTTWQIETKGKILVLEDVTEYSYRIDRLLCQLKQAGLLDECAGVVLCTWESCDPKDEVHWGIDKVLDFYFKEAPYPVIKGFPSGHIDDQVTLPLGCMAELDASQKTLRILESSLD